MAPIGNPIRADARTNGQHFGAVDAFHTNHLRHRRFHVKPPALSVKGFAAAIAAPEGKGEHIEGVFIRKDREPAWIQPGFIRPARLHRKTAILQPGRDGSQAVLLTHPPWIQDDHGAMFDAAG